MTRKLKIPVRLSVLFPILCLICAWVFADFSDPLKDAPLSGYGRPAESNEYSNLQPGIWQVLDDGVRVYVLSSSGDRFIQVYDMDGIYEKTLFFERRSSNGMFFIATEENTLYVQDEERNVYVFQGGEFIRFLKESDAEKELRHIDFRIRDSSGGYIVEYRSVWRVSEPENICIIQGKSEAARLLEFGGAVMAGLVCGGITLYLERRELFAKRKQGGTGNGKDRKAEKMDC